MGSGVCQKQLVNALHRKYFFFLSSKQCHAPQRISYQTCPHTQVHLWMCQLFLKLIYRSGINAPQMLHVGNEAMCYTEQTCSTSSDVIIRIGRKFVVILLPTSGPYSSVIHYNMQGNMLTWLVWGSYDVFLIVAQRLNGLVIMEQRLNWLVIMGQPNQMDWFTWERGETDWLCWDWHAKLIWLFQTGQKLNVLARVKQEE